MASPNDENASGHDTSARRPRYRFQRRQALRRLSPAVPSPSQVGPSQHYSTLPRQLRRPAFRAISPAAIAAIDPDLANVPETFLLRGIRDQGQVLYSSACQTVTKAPRGRLPRDMDVVITNTSAHPPTHVLAVYSQSFSAQKKRITLHPVHGLVLAANCAHLPPLPYSRPQVPECSGFIASLPVIPLAIKSPETFSTLLEYLYTQNTDSLLRSLLPVSAFHDLSAPAKLAGELARTCAPIALQVHLYRIHGLWSNVTALGVFDQALWRTMQAAWDVLQDAIA